MKIKRFFSKDMRSVIRMVREELGPDAVILANNQVNGGVEIIAAVDYDESLLQPREDASRKKHPSDDQSDVNQNDLGWSDPAPLFTSAVDSGADKNPFGESRLSFRKNTSPTDGQLNQETDDLDLEEFSAHFLEAARENEAELARGEINRDLNKSRTKTQQHAPSYTIDRELADDQVQLKSQAQKDHRQGNTPSATGQEKVSFYQNKEHSAKSEALFYNLDGAQMDSANKPIENSLYSAAAPSGEKGRPQDNVWSQEPTLVSMRNEIQILRALLEQQLTGLAWGETERRNPMRAKLLRQLLELDFHSSLARDISDYVGETSDYTNAWQVALTYVTDNLPINADELSSGGVFALLGPTGAGKTTSVAKLASKFALRYGRNNVAMITVDNYRVGAHEQLKTYARIFDIPMKVATNAATLDEAIRSLGERKYIFIDSAGLSYLDARLNNQFDLLQNSKINIQKILVLPSTYHRSTLDEIMRCFSKVKLHSCIITKIDETTSLGGSVATVMKHNVPVSFFSDGQKIPDALHVADAHALVNQSVLIARKTNQPLNRQDVEKAFVRTHRDVLL